MQYDFSQQVNDNLGCFGNRSRHRRRELFAEIKDTMRRNSNNYYLLRQVCANGFPQLNGILE
jgi:hypothetical protein